MGKIKEDNYHHGNLRQALLDLAESQLLQTRAQDLSLRALAKEIGVSQTAPYRHFADKNALLTALATKGYLSLSEKMIRAQNKKKLDPIEKLRAASKAYIDYSINNPEMFKNMFSQILVPYSKSPKLLSATILSFFIIHDIMQEGIKQGIFRSINAEALSNAAWVVVHGIATLKHDRAELFDRKIIDLNIQFDLSFDIFIRGIIKN